MPPAPPPFPPRRYVGLLQRGATWRARLNLLLLRPPSSAVEGKWVLQFYWVRGPSFTWARGAFLFCVWALGPASPTSARWRRPLLSSGRVVIFYEGARGSSSCVMGHGPPFYLGRAGPIFVSLGDKGPPFMPGRAASSSSSRGRGRLRLSLGREAILPF